MTRFNITMKEAIDLIFRAINHGNGGEIFVPKLKAYKMGDVKDAIIELLNKEPEIKKIPIRRGEKIHESLISGDEIRNTYETDSDYILFEEGSDDSKNFQLQKMKKADLKEQYSSNKVGLLTKDDLKKIIVNEGILEQN